MIIWRYVCACSVASFMSDSATLWNIACQTPLSMGFSRQEYWSELPCLPPGHLHDPGIEPISPSLQVDSLPTKTPEKPLIWRYLQRTLLKQFKQKDVQDKSQIALQRQLFSSVQFRSSVVSDSLRPHGLQHARPPYPLPTSRVHSDSCPLSRWCHPTISSSVVPFSDLQSSPASGSFQMSQIFASGGQSIRVSASASVLPLNIQYWFPLGLTGWISLLSKGLSRVFFNTTVWKHQFFSTQLSL